MGQSIGILGIMFSLFLVIDHIQGLIIQPIVCAPDYPVTFLCWGLPALGLFGLVGSLWLLIQGLNTYACWMM
jgi:hypothetical protein